MERPPLSLPFALSYNEIVEGIAMGGAIHESSDAFSVFDTLVFCAGEWQPHVAFPDDENRKFQPQILRVPYDDSYEALTPSVLAHLDRSANKIVDWHKEGQKVLITCMAGRNRSGLLVALVLRLRFEMTGKAAIDLIKEKRGPFALTNRVFTSYLLGLK
jgi:protein-tyrosine phosphatase